MEFRARKKPQRLGIWTLLVAIDGASEGFIGPQTALVQGTVGVAIRQAYHFVSGGF